MSYYQPVGYGSRLPVSPEQPDNRCGVTSTPILRMDLGPMTELLPPLTDALVLEIQNQVGKNAVRTFAFNLWGQNGYQNQAFVELLGVFAMHCEARMLMNRREDPIRIIQAEAPFFMNAAMGFLVQQYPELTGYLPPEAEPVMNAANRDWAQLTRDLRAVQAQYSHPGQGQAYGNQPVAYGGQPVGYGRGMPTQGGMGFNGMRGQQQALNANVNRADPRPIWEQDQLPQAARTTTGPGNTGFNSAYRTSAPERPYQASQPTQPEQRSVVTRETSTAPRTQPETAQFEQKARLINPNDPKPASTASAATAAKVVPPPPPPQPHQRAAGSAMKPAFGTRFYDRVPLQDGTELYAALSSPYKVAWTPERPPLAFDREQYVLFHRVNPHPTGDQVALQETLQLKADDMEYLDHELDESLKRIYRQQGEIRRPSGPAEVATLKRLVPNEAGKVGTIVSEERLKALDEAKAPRVLTTAIVADSIDGSMAEAHLEVLRHGGNGKTMEYLLKHCREYCLDKGAYSVVLDLKRSVTYEELLDKLVTHALDQPDSELADICNERLTRTFNRFLTKSMYFNWTIDSLLEDYLDAKAKVAETSGEMIQEQFAKSVRYVIDQALTVLDESELNTWFQRHLPEEANDEFEEPVVFVDPLTITTVPWSMYELEKRFRLEGLVTREKAEELYEALEAIFLRTTDPSAPADAQTLSKLREHVIVTVDGHKLYARASYLSPGLEHFAVTLEPLALVLPREARA